MIQIVVRVMVIFILQVITDKSDVVILALVGKSNLQHYHQ